jgi:hypothetical protein
MIVKFQYSVAAASILESRGYLKTEHARETGRQSRDAVDGGASH